MSSFEAELKAEIERFVEKYKKKLDKDKKKFLLLLPDLYVLLKNISKDSKIDSRIASFCAEIVDYVESPVDILPESVMGVIGYLDDIVVTIFALDAIKNWLGDDEILKKHWKGKGDIVEHMKSGVDAIDTFVPVDIFQKIVQWVRNRSIDEGLSHKANKGEAK